MNIFLRIHYLLNYSQPSCIISFMKYLLSFLLLTIAQNTPLKPFQINLNSLPPSQLNASEEALAKATHRCHLFNNLGEHSESLRKEVIPRIEEELEQLLSRQQKVNGDFFYVAESIDYGDLFHAHIRDPLSLIPYSENGGLHPQFKDSNLYHLQYHSYEFRDYTHLKWLNELLLIENAELKIWLDDLQDYQREVSSRDDFDTSRLGLPLESHLEALTEDQKILFTTLWHNSLGGQSPGLNHLSQRLSSLDPKDYNNHVSIFNYRSVVSTNDQFYVIRPLNLHDFEQSSTVYFEERSDSPEIEKIIEKAKRKGLTHIINVDARAYSDAAFDQITDKNLQRELSQEIFAAAQKTTAQNPLYMFGHVFDGEYSQNGHVLITWSDKYVFSIRYFIPCGEDQLNLWKTITTGHPDLPTPQTPF